MGRLALLVFTAGGLAAGCGVSTEEMPPGVPMELGVTRQAVTYDGHDYLIVTSPVSWEAAQAYCSIAGYHLVTVDDAAEESFLETQGYFRGLDNWWIGYNDRGIEGSWIWAYGWSSYTNWAPGEPNNAAAEPGEDCAEDSSYLAGAWNDLTCNSERPFICEREALATGNRGTFSYSASDTGNATTNTTNFAVYLYAGQLFTMGTCGVPDASGSGDTYLRLNDPFGSEIAHNDDADGPCGYLSNISIIAPVTGTYVIRAGCFEDNSCSGVVAFNY